MSAAKFIVFVKAPRPETVKTRLARAIGATAATAAYETMVANLMTGLAQLRDVQLRFAPDEAEAEVAHWRCAPAGRQGHKETATLATVSGGLSRTPSLAALNGW